MGGYQVTRYFAFLLYDWVDKAEGNGATGIGCSVFGLN